jgi:hypothetical protein
MAVVGFDTGIFPKAVTLAHQNGIAFRSCGCAQVCDSKRLTAKMIDLQLSGIGSTELRGTASQEDWPMILQSTVISNIIYK